MKPVSGFCASGKDEENACGGDSGGPVIWIDRTTDENKEYLIGTPSGGYCGKKQPTTVPSIFAAIPGKVGEWIYEKLTRDHVAICT